MKCLFLTFARGTDEPDTGEVVPQQGMNTSKCIRACDIHDFMKNTMKCEMGNEEECLINKGGFWDQVMLASEVFRREVIPYVSVLNLCL